MNSEIAFNPALNVFEERPVDASVENVTYSTHNLLQALDQVGPYVFQIEPSDRHIYLRGISLRIKCKITKADGTAIEATAKVGPLNNVLHTLIQKLEIKVGDQNVSGTDTLYPYKAYMETLLNGTPDEKDSRLFSEGFILDRGSALDNINPEAGEAVRNTGLQKRRDTYFAESQSAVLIGRLHGDFLNVNKCLLDGVPLRLTLYRSPDKFCLVGEGNEYKIKIEEMTLLVPYVTPSEAMRRSLQNVLEKTPARYDFTRGLMQTRFVSSGLTEISFPSLFRGKLPTRVALAFVRQENVVPAYDKYGFNFENFKVSKIVLRRNQAPLGHAQGLSIENSATSLTHTDAYWNFLQNAGRLGKGSIVSLEDFDSGFSIYPFNLVEKNESSDVDSSSLNVGVLDLQLSFKTATPAHLSLIVLAQFDETLYIDKLRNVKLGPSGSGPIE